MVTLKPEQQSLLTKCPDDFLYKVTRKNGEQWVTSVAEYRKQYKECAIRHNGLVDVIKGDSDE